eukprot:Hpha_TRINITY_DN22314_c0_g1::TRINITY_DN22314_c0_g1_i1::g.177873::m.177873
MMARALAGSVRTASLTSSGIGWRFNPANHFEGGERPRARPGEPFLEDALAMPSVIPRAAGGDILIPGVRTDEGGGGGLRNSPGKTGEGDGPVGDIGMAPAHLPNRNPPWLVEAGAIKYR